MNDKPIVVVTGGRSLTEQIAAVFGQDAVVIVDDIASVERELIEEAYERPLRLPDPITMEIAMRREIADDLRRTATIYLDRPAKDWQQNQRRGRMKPRRR